MKPAEWKFDSVWKEQGLLCWACEPMMCESGHLRPQSESTPSPLNLNPDLGLKALNPGLNQNPDLNSHITGVS